ncbi:MAG: malate dehydrogenase [Prevotellaceae bacterium]|jgi:malate dehydrogenase|nr:malate dehydrogenase [Prevotellaceae bacterium]
MAIKVTVVGAGNVGATCADVLATREVASEVVLLDIKEGVSEGKAMDIMQTAALAEFGGCVKGVTNDYAATGNSNVVVITSGIPRKPGMTREELIGVNAGIVKSVVENILKYSPNTILIIVSNPMDAMCYLAAKTSGLPRNRVLGLGGALDSSRFKYYLSKALGANSKDIEATVIGGHGDTTMVPLASLATYRGVPVTKFLSKEELDEVVSATKVGGATLTKLLGTSAWYAPGAAAASMVESIVRNQKRIIPCGVVVEGEYGEKDLAIGVPVVLGENGWEKIVDFPISEEEKNAFKASADATRKVNQIMVDNKMI